MGLLRGSECRGASDFGARTLTRVTSITGAVNTMKCEHCGAELPQGAGTCPACGKEVGLLTKTGDVAERTGEKTVEVGTKVGKGALKLGGKGLSAVGGLAKKAGKKLEETGEK
jgi:hypothetical protein